MELYVPDMYQENIFTVNYKKLKEDGIQFILFDLDNTIVPYEIKEVDTEVSNLMQKLKEDGVTPIIFSNSPKNRVKYFANILEIEFVYSARKPSAKKFAETLKKYRTNENAVAIIGDQMVTDIKGGNRVGITTILVNPIGKDPYWTKPGRFKERRLKQKLRKQNLFSGRFYDEKM